MSKLEQLFQIEDDKERIKELVEYARSLKVNFLKAKKEDGTYSENELAVLIHAAEQTRKTTTAFSISFAIAGVVILCLFIIIMFLFVNYRVPAR